MAGTWPPQLFDLQQVLRAEDQSDAPTQTAALAAAIASIQEYCGQSFVSQPYTETDSNDRFIRASRMYDPPYSIRLKHTPVDLSQPLTITDADGNVVVGSTDTFGNPTTVNGNPSTYWVDPLSGIINCVYPNDFGFGPYTISYFAGLAAHPRWNGNPLAGIPGLSQVAYQCALDFAVNLCSQRVSVIKAEGAGGGVTTTYFEQDLPPRICALLGPLKRLRIGC